MNFSVHMDPQTLRQVELLAKKLGKSRNALVNIAVNEFVRNCKESAWPDPVARWLADGASVKIRNFAGFEAQRGELGGLREVEL